MVFCIFPGGYTLYIDQHGDWEMVYESLLPTLLNFSQGSHSNQSHPPCFSPKKRIFTAGSRGSRGSRGVGGVGGTIEGWIWQAPSGWLEDVPRFS